MEDNSIISEIKDFIDNPKDPGKGVILLSIVRHGHGTLLKKLYPRLCGNSPSRFSPDSEEYKKALARLILELKKYLPDPSILTEEAQE